MGKKQAAYLSGAIILLLVISVFIYSQISAQNGDGLTQGDFITTLIQVMGLEELVAAEPAADPTADPADTFLERAISVLTRLKYTPWGGSWDPDALLTNGDVAFVLCIVLGYIPPPEDWSAVDRDSAIADAFTELSAHGIIIDVAVEGQTIAQSVITESVLAEVINAASAATGGTINPYPEPVSPPT